MPSYESCCLSQGHGMEYNTSQPAKLGTVTKTICLNVIRQLEITGGEGGEKGQAKQMLWAQEFRSGFATL